ncbi:MAG: aldo/keto reductase, partial [Gemmatimonadota bacterium]|nr:aldo/keto reductase [Gemmatimonadota bacterium]
MDNSTKRTLGRTGLEVTQLGFGAAERGLPDEAEYDDQAGGVLNAALDAGINLVDTAPDYGASEERVGKYLGHRRDEFFLATKCGCNIDEEGNRLDPNHLWTAERLRTNIDQSLRRLKTDCVDLLQMHNPTVEDVELGGLIEVLEDIRQAGKTRFIGVSSTLPHLAAFVESGAFDVFQIPYSALE